MYRRVHGEGDLQWLVSYETTTESIIPLRQSQRKFSVRIRCHSLLCPFDYDVCKDKRLVRRAVANDSLNFVCFRLTVRVFFYNDLMIDSIECQAAFFCHLPEDGIETFRCRRQRNLFM